jgi:hypothetical protein
LLRLNAENPSNKCYASSVSGAITYCPRGASCTVLSRDGKRNFIMKLYPLSEKCQLLDFVPARMFSLHISPIV